MHGGTAPQKGAIVLSAAVQGTHFFQNIASFGIGYVTVYSKGEGHVSYDWLAAHTAVPQHAGWHAAMQHRALHAMMRSMMQAACDVLSALPMHEPWGRCRSVTDMEEYVLCCAALCCASPSHPW